MRGVHVVFSGNEEICLWCPVSITALQEIWCVASRVVLLVSLPKMSEGLDRAGLDHCPQIWALRICMLQSPACRRMPGCLVAGSNEEAVARVFPPKHGAKVTCVGCSYAGLIMMPSALAYTFVRVPSTGKLFELRAKAVVFADNVLYPGAPPGTRDRRSGYAATSRSRKGSVTLEDGASDKNLIARSEACAAVHCRWLHRDRCCFVFSKDASKVLLWAIPCRPLLPLLS